MSAPNGWSTTPLSSVVSVIRLRWEVLLPCRRYVESRSNVHHPLSLVTGVVIASVPDIVYIAEHTTHSPTTAEARRRISRSGRMCPYQGDSSSFSALSLMLSFRSHASTAPPAGYGTIDRIRSKPVERRHSPMVISLSSAKASHEVDCPGRSFASVIDYIVSHSSTTT